MSIEKYGITDAHYLCDSAIFNTETDEILRLYQICDLLNQQSQQIADLEAKLAEKEHSIGMLNQHLTDKAIEIERLGEELEEKEKEIEDYQKLINDICNKYRVCSLKELPISFCIEQLEKVKKYADIDFRKNCYINAVELDKFIDNQIKQLKEMK